LYQDSFGRKAQNKLGAIWEKEDMTGTPCEKKGQWGRQCRSRSFLEEFR